MRRILAYSIVNQVGFMVVGIGIGTEMALNGAAAHAFAAHHLQGAAADVGRRGAATRPARRKCTDLGGLFQQHAADRRLRHRRRRCRSPSFPLTSRLRQQVDDRAGRGRRAPAAPSGCCWRRPRPACSCMPASSSPGSSSSRRTPACARPSRRATCWPPCCSSPRCASASASSRAALRDAAVTRSTTRPIPASHVVTQLQLLLFSGAGLLRACCTYLHAHADDHARRRLVLSRISRLALMAAVRSAA